MVVNLAAYQNLDDHLGTTQMELSSGGWPLWQGQFTPFGQEIIGGTATNYLGPQPADGTTMHYKFTGKERDTESGLDYFGARYYASNMGRWMSPDWADKPEAVPYSSLDNPQSLNLYGYVGNNPLSRADADGHCCSWDDVKQFAAGAVNAYASDNLLGRGRVDMPTAAGQLGSIVGDGAAAYQGIQEVAAGLAGEVGGTLLDATGVGALVGIPAQVVSAGLVAHGAVTGLEGAGHLLAKAHGNTAGNQPAELHEKTDKDGNLEKHGVSQDASKRYSKADVGEGKVTVTDRGPRKEMLAKERQKVETNPGPKNREPWAGKKKDQ